MGAQKDGWRAPGHELDNLSRFNSIEAPMHAKRLLNTPLEERTNTSIVIDGREVPAVTGEPLMQNLAM
jgi:hypothetical protein